VVTASTRQAELRALIEALKLAKQGDVILTDSRYAIDMVTKGWRAKANVELVTEARKLYESKPGIEIRWIRGHNGHAHQEHSDLLATVAAQTQQTRRWHERAS
jgi:ribonuclease HI